MYDPAIECFLDYLFMAFPSNGNTLQSHMVSRCHHQNFAIVISYLYDAQNHKDFTVIPILQLISKNISEPLDNIDYLMYCNFLGH